MKMALKYQMPELLSAIVTFRILSNFIGSEGGKKVYLACASETWHGAQAGVIAVKLRIQT